MDQIIRLNEFFVEGGQREISHVLLHITEPSTPQEMEKGYFFAVCEINQAETKYITKLQELIDEAENEYYETESAGDKTALEIVLGKINEGAKTLAEHPGETHCIIGAIQQPEITFAYCGHPQIVLFYKNRQGSYQKMNLLADEENTPTEDKQLFSQIIQGKLGPNDFLFVGTPSINNYFDHDRLEKIITTRSSIQSAQHLERTLGEIKDGYSFGGLIINSYQPPAGQNIATKKIRPTIKGEGTKSLHSFFNTEQNTTNTLSPSFLPKFNQSMKNFLNNPEEDAAPEPVVEKNIKPTVEVNATHSYTHQSSRQKLQEKQPLITKIIPIKNTLFSAIKLTIKGIWWILLTIYLSIYAIISGLVQTLFVITNWQNRRRGILEDWGRRWHEFKENIIHLPTITKVMLGGSIILAIIFTSSIVYIRWNQKRDLALKVYQSQIQDVRNKKDAMESALVYKDEAAALNEYQSAKDILNKIDCSSKVAHDTCAELSGQLDNFLQKARKTVGVNPELLASWDNLATTNLELIKIANKLLIYSPSSSNITIYDIMTKESKNISSYTTINGFTEAAVPKENDFAVLGYQQHEFIKFDPNSNNVQKIDIAYPDDNVNIVGAGIYNRRLYALDAQNGQIYRHNVTKTGFDQGKTWLKEKDTSLSNGTDLTIDGDVFILKNDGQIVKFTSGKLQDFVIQGLSPALTSGGQIWTYADVPNIYVLEKATQRLVVLEKDGKLKEQITSPLFKNPTGMAIDAANNIAYVVDSGKLYKIVLP